jgi:hypothetical protein
MIRTRDREALHKHGVVIHPRPGGFHFACDRCSFARDWATEKGAVQEVSDHMRRFHSVRVVVAGLSEGIR